MKRFVLFWDIMEHTLLILYQHSGTTYRSHLHRDWYVWKCWYGITTVHCTISQQSVYHIHIVAEAWNYILWSLDIKNREAFYWENVKWGDVMWCLPVFGSRTSINSFKDTGKLCFWMTVFFVIAVFLCSELSHVQSSLVSRVLRVSVTCMLSGGLDTGSSPCSVQSFYHINGYTARQVVTQ